MTSSLSLKHHRERTEGLTFTFACLLSVCRIGLFSLYAIMWHSLALCVFVHFLDVLIRGHGQPGLTTYHAAPPGAMVSDAQHNIRVDYCHSSSTSANAHEVGHMHTYPMPQTYKQFTSLINIADLSLVKYFVPKSEEFVPVGIFSTVSFPLRTASWSHKCLISMCFALPNLFCLLQTVPHWSRCAAESGRLYPLANA